MATLKRGTVVQRNPGEYKAGQLAEVLYVDQTHPIGTSYVVRLIEGADAGQVGTWIDRCFHVYAEPPLNCTVPESLEVGGVTTTRRTVTLNSARGAGLKDDGGKEQPRLLHQGTPRALAEVVRTLTFGARKYAPNSWQQVEKAEERYQDASYRHDAARCRGELIDPETGIRHRAHHIINELFLLELELKAQENA